MGSKVVLSLIWSAGVMSTALNAEIEVINVQWMAPKCIGSCINRVTNQFRRLSGTAELIVNQAEGQIWLRWKPYAPFRVDAITNTMSAIGLRSQDIRLRVRGTISRSGRGFVLRSMGDNSMFNLIAPPPVSSTLFIPTRTLDTHVLSPALQHELAQAERHFVVVVIEGPLFTALRHPGKYLIVERLKLHRLAPKATTR